MNKIKYYIKPKKINQKYYSSDSILGKIYNKSDLSNLKDLIFKNTEKNFRINKILYNKNKLSNKPSNHYKKKFFGDINEKYLNYKLKKNIENKVSRNYSMNQSQKFSCINKTKKKFLTDNLKIKSNLNYKKIKLTDIKRELETNSYSMENKIQIINKYINISNKKLFSKFQKLKKYFNK